jgi:GNAT superfamily N-acetyltransferase
MNIRYMYIGIQTMELKISPIEPSELGQTMNLIVEVAENEMGFPPEAINRYRDALAKSSNNLLLGARKNGDLVGVLVCLFPEGGIATILWLIVASNYRGQGIGSKLFDEACKWALDNGCHKIKLTASTEDAVSFYKLKGMIIEGFHPNHWWHLDFWSLGKLL